MKLSKKALSLFAAAVLLISLLSVIPTATVGAEDANLVTNGTFEDGISGWVSVHGTTGATSTTANNTTVHQASTAKAHSGSKSLEATLKQAKNELYTEVTGLTPGKTYRFSAWVSGGNDVGFNTELYVLEGAGKATRDLASLVDSYYRSDDSNRDTNKAALDAATLVVCTTGAIDYWTEVVYDFVPTQSSVTIVYNNNSDRVSYLDDVSIVEKQDTENLVVNGTFDTNIDHWSTYAYKYDAATDRYYNPNVTDEREYKFENGKLVNTKYSNPTLTQMVPVVPGKTYVLTAVMQATTIEPGVYVTNHEEGQTIRAWADNYKNSTYKHISTTNNSGTVQPVEIEFEATSNVVMVGFNNPGGAWASLDNVVIVEKESGLSALGGQSCDGYDAMRFGFSVDTTAGIDYASEDSYVRGDMSNAAFYVDGFKRAVTDFGVMLSVKENATEADLTVGVNSGSSAKISAEKLYDVENGTVTFVATLINIPEGMFDRGVSTRAYVEYVDADGATQYVYSDTLVYSLNYLREQTPAE